MKRPIRALCVAAILAAPAFPGTLAASCPDRLAGRLDTGIRTKNDSGAHYEHQWYQYFGRHELGLDGVVRFDFAIAPFDSGRTFVGLDRIDGATVLGIDFANGVTSGDLAYRTDGWNDVSIEIDFATQSFTLAINGEIARGLPLAAVSGSPEPTTSLQALRVHRFMQDQAAARAWIDEITIASPGSEPMFRATFDDDSSYTAGPGTIATATPPGSLRLPSSCFAWPPLAMLSTLLDELAGDDRLPDEGAASLGAHLAAADDAMGRSDRAAARSSMMAFKGDVAALEAAHSMAVADGARLRTAADGILAQLEDAPSSVEEIRARRALRMELSARDR